MEYKKVTVIGLGYIGFPLATLILSKGIDVVGIDKNKELINKINSGEFNYPENDINEIFSSRKGKFQIKNKIDESDVFIICISTYADNFERSRKEIENIVLDICKVLKPKDLIIIESTCRVGTMLEIKKLISKTRPDLFDYGGKMLFSLSYCPERIIPGNVYFELINNDRIIGVIDLNSSKVVKNFYKKFISGNITITDFKTAEMVKLSENSFRNVNIAFANELSMICEKHNVDVTKVIEFANCHPRVNILKPGIGVGGNCIPYSGDLLCKKSKFLSLAKEININKKAKIIHKIFKIIKNSKKTNILFLGLTYKANVSIIDNSPALDIALKIKSYGFNIMVVEPNVQEKFIYGIKNIDLYNGIENSDIIILLVAHKQFKNLKKVKLKNKIFVDVLNYIKG